MVAAKPNTTGIVIAPTYGMLRDATLETFLQVADPVVTYYSRSKNIAYCKGGAKILFRSADQPDKLRGPNLHWAWIDEAGLCRSGTWEIVIGRLRADQKSGDCWLTTTPKGKTNWLYKHVNQMNLYRATTLDNPYTSDEWKQSLLTNYTGSFLQQEVYGEFVSFEGLVYGGFDRSIHLQERSLSDFVQIGYAVDEGYTNPAVILKIGVTADSEFHVIREWYKTGKVHSEIVAEAIAMAGGEAKGNVIIDSSAAGLRAAFRQAGFSVMASSGRVIDGINAVSSMLQLRGNGKPRLTIDPSCVNMIQEFESYVWQDNKDAPVKQFDHSMDALRYFITRHLKPVQLSAEQVRY